MECIICHGNDIEKKEVKEEIKDGNNIIYITISIPVCLSCGERYYDRNTIRKIDELKKNIKTKECKEVGKIYELI